MSTRGDRAHYSGLQTCGSVWSCPCCSAKIQAERSDELVQAVERAHALGYRVAMATLTMRHKRPQRLSPMWDALSDAWAAAMGRDRAVRDAMAELGVVGWVRRVECTHGANGWHLHAHALVFYRQGELGPLADAMWSGWLRRLGVHGYDAEREHGIDLRELRIDQAREEIAGYLNKATYEQTSGTAARELAGQLGKASRRGGRTPFDVLADLARDGLASDLAIWSEWEEASKGRRALTWSKNLRDLVRCCDERTDEEIAADNDGEQLDVALLPVDVWSQLVARRLEVRLLEAVEASPGDAFDALSTFLMLHELPAARRAPARE